jgi:S-adenosylmethionine hydrolase
VALVTDFDLGDWFVGVMKGVILSVNPEAKAIDIVHRIPRHDVVAASFGILASYQYLPPGAVMVIVVDPGVGTSRSIVCVKTAGRYFLAPDNGVLAGLIRQEGYEKIVSVENDEYFLKPVSSTFHGRDIFAPVAGHLSLGLDMSRLGPEIETIKGIEIPSPHIEGDALVTTIQWVDSFGNLITNCPEDLARELTGKWGNSLAVAGRQDTIAIVSDYESADVGCLLGIVGSTGYLEISVRQGSAAEVLELKAGDRLILEKG